MCKFKSGLLDAAAEAEALSFFSAHGSFPTNKGRTVAGTWDLGEEDEARAASPPAAGVCGYSDYLC